jgi:hypothetical protein
MGHSVVFKNGDATYTVHELTVMQVSLRYKIAVDIKEAWIKAHEYSDEDYPRKIDVLPLAYVDYLFTTDIEGDPGFTVVNPALMNGEIVEAYEQWETAIMSNRDLQRDWDNAVKEANKELTDPQASSDVPTGATESTEP